MNLLEAILDYVVPIYLNENTDELVQELFIKFKSRDYDHSVYYRGLADDHVTRALKLQSTLNIDYNTIISLRMKAVLYYSMWSIYYEQGVDTAIHQIEEVDDNMKDPNHFKLIYDLNNWKNL